MNPKLFKFGQAFFAEFLNGNLFSFLVKFKNQKLRFNANELLFDKALTGMVSRQ